MPIRLVCRKCGRKFITGTGYHTPRRYTCLKCSK